MDDPHRLSVAQAAEALGVSERTVWRYLRAGRLEGETIGPAGAQRTLILPGSVDAIRAGREGGAALGALQAERDRLVAELAAAQAERDQRVAELEARLGELTSARAALTRRVATLQLALGRRHGPAPLARLAEWGLLTLGRLRALRGA